MTDADAAAAGSGLKAVQALKEEKAEETTDPLVPVPPSAPKPDEVSPKKTATEEKLTATSSTTASKSDDVKAMAKKCLQGGFESGALEKALSSKKETKAEEPKAEEKPAEEKPKEEPKAEEKPAEEKPAEEKPAEEKPDTVAIAKQLHAAFEKVDKSGDGVISTSEFLMCMDLPEAFKDINFAEAAGDDRKMSWTELVAALVKLEKFSADDAKEILAATASATDKAVVSKELAEAKAEFDKLAGDDGVVTLMEFFGATNSPMLKGMNFAAAAGDDKKMTFEEFTAYLISTGKIPEPEPPKPSKEDVMKSAKELHAAFEKVDASSDGVVSTSEFLLCDLPAAFKGISFADAAGDDRKMSWTELVAALVKLEKFSADDAKEILAATASAADKKVVSKELEEAKAVFDKLGGDDGVVTLMEFFGASNSALLKGMNFSAVAGDDRKMTFEEFKTALVAAGKIPEDC